MTRNHILGAIAVALGVFLLGYAYHASSAPMDQVSNMMTGRYTGHTMLYLLAGIAATVGGGLMLFLAGRRTRGIGR